MIFYNKRNNGTQFSSSKEMCLSVIGLCLAIGFISGLAGLVYGLIRDRSSGIVGGAIVLGVSIFLIVVFILLMVFCPINNNVDSNMSQQQQQQETHHHHHPHQQESHHHHHQQQQETHHHHHHQQEPNVQMKHINSPHGITTTHRYEPTNDLNLQGLASSIPIELTDSGNYGFSKQLTGSPLKTTTFDLLHQSSSSINNRNRY